MPRKPWDIAFTAEPSEVATLRRITLLQLETWGLSHLADEAQLCVSELVSNVIKHVGPGTPATLAVSMKSKRLRIEVHDPDTRAFPTLRAADTDAEAGRGMALVDAVADRWGVQLAPDHKITWCELATRLATAHGYVEASSVVRAEALVRHYAAAAQPQPRTEANRLTSTVAEETVIAAITDFLHWFRAHGRDADDMLDRAQMRFEAESGVLGRQG